MADHPKCQECEKEGKFESATVVDHVIPHKDDEELFWNEGNWAALCKTHHDVKTATRDGGFGREVKHG